MKRLSVLCLAMILIAGCITYHPRPLEPLRTAAAFEARNLDNPTLKKFVETYLHLEIRPWPPVSWDFTLLSLAALYYHPDLEMARARLKSVEASIITAGVRPNPTLTFTPELSSNPQVGLSPWILTPALDIPIETAGKRGFRLNKAKYLAQAAGFDVATTVWQVRTKLRQALLDLSAARQSSLILEKKAKIMEELVALFRQRLAAGEVSENEVTATQLVLDRAELQLQSAQTRESEARINIASSIGLPAGALGKIAISTKAEECVPSLAAIPLPDARRRALLGRPDVVAALAEYAAAESALQLEMAKQYPDVSLGPGYSWDQGENKWILGFTVTLPTFDRNEGPIAEAEARREEVAARFVALQARIMGEIDKATAASDAAVQKLKAADAILMAQRSHFISAQAMFNAGELDRVELLNAQLAHHDGELFRLDVVTDLRNALALLEDALHYPLAPPPASADPGQIPGQTRSAE